jgi:hypothetical protein
MHSRLAIVIISCLGLGACVGAPRIGSASLSSNPSPHLDPSPFQLIDAQLRHSVVFSECGASNAQPGPASNLDASLIPSDEYVQNGRRAQALTQPYRFSIDLSKGALKGSTLAVTVPAGFVSDFHSMPDTAVGLTLPVRKALEAAVIHDWLYAVGAPGDAAEKALADQGYADILAHYGVEGFTHWAVSSGVRMGGKKSFGAPVELRFYNKCFYRQCPSGATTGWPELADSPVVALKPDPVLRERLWNLTVCIRYPAPASELASLEP